ncbi:uncharacterized protein LOC116251478 isoform X2 [Nymphaea colorata]|uniref:uncharacterized protein LOC116251478 isoform X2 n=1 Tax=Nymphaea colorata TaxID=210225 RepID=UPI00129D4441|nr:uncharacterized protein LOC116251478 isoform X2 [Nymphaea colorata]
MVGTLPLPAVLSLIETANWRFFRSKLLPALSLLVIVFYVGSTFVVSDSKESFSRWGVFGALKDSESKCKVQCRVHGTESLPKGIVSATSNLEMRRLWGTSKDQMKRREHSKKSLLAIAVGIRQKKNVDRIVKKFPPSNFTIMLFHYDGFVDQWRDLQWSDNVLHVSAVNQTKWWFAKRFLHPDVVDEYNYIFLWDEDLGVEHFDPVNYLSIVEKEGLEISQPALDPSLSEVHHRITVRVKKSRVHRRTYKNRGNGRCYWNSTAPPCTGWVEMMAPVFSRAAWRCAWYMIQSDLIHAWGLDMKLGYCAQGDRSINVGVVDSEYVAHLGIPTLGGLDENRMSREEDGRSSRSEGSARSAKRGREVSLMNRERGEVRKQSYNELEIFQERWEKAVKDDTCWNDPYPQTTNRSRAF